jgi:catechol 2,3-dioxygenase-like lactoylglutathione lyase family enzyme
MARLGHTVLTSTDVEQTRRFLMEGLGFTLKMSGYDGGYCELLDDEQRVLALVTPGLLHETFPEARLAPHPLTPMDALALTPSLLLSFHVSDLPSTLERLKPLGGECLTPPKTMAWGSTVAVFTVPGCRGVLLELSQP